jgi:murein DD-endopeptidase MepM/ murein hydrolase activator NlpD
MRTLTTAIAGCLLAAAVPGAAHGSTGGAASPSTPAWISSVTCRTDCVDPRTARPGSLLRLKGGAMKRVRHVTFVGAPGPRDDTSAPPAESTPRSVVVRVPDGAVSGRLRVRTSDGALSRPSAVTIGVGGSEAPAGPATAGGAPPAPTGEHAFPVQGKHDFGQSQARFGAGRSGHSHQGHDVFAACGTPVVAARGGTVRWKAFQSRAGNYLVVATDEGDHAYMHLQGPALAGKGETVATGQPLGAVGDTGAASGCHLHFEIWTAPGWHEGGSPIDPLPALKAWAAGS